MSIGARILTWASGLPLWQQVALRMLTEGESLSDAQTDTLASLALSEMGHVPAFGDTSDRAVLTAAHLGTLSAGRPNTRLLGLSNTKNVNRLAAGQELKFGADGLTVVYGDNGSGKSGYARILKRTCGARCAGQPILSDVYSGTNGAAAANLSVQLDDKAETINWTDGKDAAPVLPEVGFFDLECASVQISEKNAVMLTPPGLDLLERFGGACGQVRQRLVDYRDATSRTMPELRLPQDLAGSDWAGQVAAIGANTDVDALRKSVVLTNVEAAELERLVAEAANDPSEVVKSCEVLERLVAPLGDALKEVADTSRATAATERAEKHRAFVAADEAAKAASSSLFSGEPLPNIDNAAWTALWEAARHYSDTIAYPSAAFPATGEGSVCPLCQQELSPAAAGRLGRFEEFVKKASASEAAEAHRALQAAERPLLTACSALSQFATNVAALAAHDSGLADQLRGVLTVASATESCPAYEESLALHQLTTDVLGDLLAMGDELAGTRLTAVELLNEEAAAARRKRIVDLRARGWLAEHSNDIIDSVRVAKVLGSIEAASRSCNTNSVSSMASKLSAEYVTSGLEKAFAKELASMQVRQLPVVLAKSGTRKGTSLHRLELAGASTIAPSKVLSEGEQKCIAVAAFMAEIHVAGDGSGIVFDDPVTSLDHRWQHEVAKRLAQEAAKRQVIVFTHDLPFLMNLLEQSAQHGVQVTTLRLRRSSGAVGLVEDGLPWAGMTVKKRIGVLKNRAQTAVAVYARDGEGQYEPYARVTYSMLREAWERAVEEVLLNEAVVRLRRGVETQRLKSIRDITQADLDCIESAMTKCSRSMLGHDQAAGVNEGVPLPEELLADIHDLEGWVKGVRARRGNA